MLYLVYLHDIPDNADIRQRQLDKHMQHIGGFLGRIRLGGPLLRPDTDSPAGGMLIVDAGSEDEVRAMIEADPYYLAGLWDDVRIHAFREIINAWRSPDQSP